MTQLEHRLERHITICAQPATVFRFFTDSERFARWWGSGSRIVPEPGGEVVICYPNGVRASGRVEAIDPPRCIVFTYGYEDPAKPIPPGGSRVTLTLHEDPDGTRLHLLHELPDAATRDEHVQGWRFQLSLFANVAAADQHVALASLADRFLAAWSEPDSRVREQTLHELAEEGVSFRDPYSCLTGRNDLLAHMGASQRFRPRMRLERVGAPKQCQGTALVDFVVRSPDGAEQARGTNVLDLGPDGRLRRVVGMWG